MISNTWVCLYLYVFILFNVYCNVSVIYPSISTWYHRRQFCLRRAVIFVKVRWSKPARQLWVSWWLGGAVAMVMTCLALGFSCGCLSPTAMQMSCVATFFFYGHTVCGRLPLSISQLKPHRRNHLTAVQKKQWR